MYEKCVNTSAVLPHGAAGEMKTTFLRTRLWRSNGGATGYLE
jgi:hypothetical protein